MIERVTSRAVMIQESEKQLNEFIRLNNKGFWKDQGYTDKEIADKLNLFKKDLAYTKNEISFAEYREAYDIVHRRKKVC